MKSSQILAASDRPEDEFYVLVAAPVVVVRADLARNFRIILDQNITDLRIDGGTSGADVCIRVEQDPVGSWAVTPNTSIVYRNGAASLGISATASAVTYIYFRYDDGARVWEVVTPTPGSGTVTNLTMPAEFSVATATTTPAVTWAAASGRKFIASPSDGTSGAYAGRAIVSGDIPVAAISLAQMADLAQDKFIVRTTASTGVPETATVTAAARTVLDDTDTASMRTTLGVPQNLTSITSIVLSIGDTSEHDLMTYTIAAGRLATNGDRIVGRAVFFTNAGAPATRDIRLYFGATAIYESGAVATLTTTTVVLDFEIIRTGAATQKASVVVNGNFSVLSSIPQRTAPGETLSGTVVIKGASQQGAGAAAADVTQASMTVDFVPVGP